MSTRIVTLLAAHPNANLLIAQHDRCARWAINNDHVIREKILIRGEDANDHEAIRSQLKALADSSTMDLIVMESISVLGSDGVEVMALVDYLKAKNVEIFFLKERNALPNCRAIILFGAYRAFMPDQACVYFGSTDGKIDAREWADRLGWSMSLPRRKNPTAPGFFADRRRRAVGKILVIESLRVLPAKTTSDLLAIFLDLDARGQHYILLDHSIDSTAPNHQSALRAAIILASPRAQSTPKLPDNSTLLVEWANRKLGRNSESIRSYQKMLKVNPNVFFNALRDFIKTLKDYSADHGFEDTMSHFDLPEYALNYALNWYAESESRKRKT